MWFRAGFTTWPGFCYTVFYAHRKVPVYTKPIIPFKDVIIVCISGVYTYEYINMVVRNIAGDKLKPCRSFWCLDSLVSITQPDQRDRYTLRHTDTVTQQINKNSFSVFSNLTTLLTRCSCTLASLCRITNTSFKFLWCLRFKINLNRWDNCFDQNHDMLVLNIYYISKPIVFLSLLSTSIGG